MTDIEGQQAYLTLFWADTRLLFFIMPLFLPAVYGLNILSLVAALSSLSLRGVIVYLCFISLCWSDFFSVNLLFSIPGASKMVITL